MIVIVTTFIRVKPGSAAVHRALFGLNMGVGTGKPMPQRPVPASHRFLLILGVCLLGACAQAPRVHDADLAGDWEGTIAPMAPRKGSVRRGCDWTWW
jgi:hypothetical protein